VLEGGGDGEHDGIGVIELQGHGGEAPAGCHADIILPLLLLRRGGEPDLASPARWIDDDEWNLAGGKEPGPEPFAVAGGEDGGAALDGPGALELEIREVDGGKGAQLIQKSRDIVATALSMPDGGPDDGARSDLEGLFAPIRDPKEGIGPRKAGIAAEIAPHAASFLRFSRHRWR
jgi:hypothetical protein